MKISIKTLLLTSVALGLHTGGVYAYSIDELATANVTSGDRVVYFSESTEPQTYTLPANLGSTAAGTIEVYGNSVDDAIDANSHVMFNAQSNAVNINIHDVTIQNASASKASVIQSTNTGSSQNLQNVKFLSNRATGGNGGAIISKGTLTIKDSILNSNTASGKGGAISSEDSSASVSVTNTEFKSNQAGGNGGAINTSGTVISVGGTFEDNVSTGGKAGAVYADAGVDIDGTTFYGNKSSGTGGAISTKNAVIKNAVLEGNESSGNKGGALYASGTAEISNTEFNENKTTSSNDGGAIYAEDVLTIENSSFTDNSSGRDSGAIYSAKYATITNSQFTGNTAVGKGGVAYTKQLDWVVSGSDFSKNEATSGGTFYVAGNSLDISSSTFSENVASDLGGALYAAKEVSITNSTFENNSAGSNGGAIYNLATLNITSDGSKEGSVLFKGNHVGEDNYEAIYGKNTSSVINFLTKSSGEYTFYDYMNSDGNTVVNFAGEDGGTFNLYNDINNMKTVNFDANYSLNMISPEDILSGVSAINKIYAANIVVNSDLTLSLDADLEAQQIDHFEATSMAINGTITVDHINVIKDTGNDEISVAFLPENTTGKENVTSVAVARSVNYTYNVTYDPVTGEFHFAKSNPVDPDEVSANTASSIASSAMITVNETIASQILNRDINTFLGLNSGDAEAMSAWVQAFGSDGDVKLKHLHGAIDAQFYGLLGGIDSKQFVYDNGVQAVYGLYGAYVGSSQKYHDSKIKQHGGYLGASVAFRKDDLFNNITVNVGYINNEADTMWGKDHFDTKIISASNKTGIDIKKDEWTFTPSLFLGYMGIDTDDYTTKAGTKVKNSFMNVFTIAPEIKAVKDFGIGFDGYVKVTYKMFFYDNYKIKANGILLNEMSVKPYIEYGIGFSKDWSKEEWSPKDITSYIELNRQDGGRTGWDVNLGLKLDF